MHFVPVAFAEIREATRRHLRGLPSAIDSFLEDHILVSNHYRIDVAGETAGFASIHEERLITQFALAEAYRRCGLTLFAELRRMEPGAVGVRADLRRVLPGARARRLPAARQAGVFLRYAPWWRRGFSHRPVFPATGVNGRCRFRATRVG